MAGTLLFRTTPEQQENLKGVMSYLWELFDSDRLDLTPEYYVLDKAGQIARMDQGVYDLLVLLRDSVDHNGWKDTWAEVAAVVRDYENVPTTK